MTANMQAIYGLWLRELTQFLRSRSRIIGWLITPMMILVFLAFGFRGVALPGLPADVDYLQYLVAGIAGFTILFSASFTGLGILSDREVGFHLVAPELVITEALQSPVISEAVVRLSISSVIAMMLTTIGMLMTKTNHPAACATTLIVSLGLLSTVIDAITIILAVVILVGAHDYIIYPAAIKFGFEPEDPQKE